MTHSRMWQKKIAMLLLKRLISTQDKSLYIWSDNQGFLKVLLIPKEIFGSLKGQKKKNWTQTQCNTYLTMTPGKGEVLKGG